MRNMFRTLVRSLVRAVIGAALIAAPAAHAADSAKIGTVVWIGYGPYYVANALDLFKNSGVKVTLQFFTDPALIPPAIESGAVDGGMLTYDQVIAQVARGSTQRVVMPIDYSDGGDAIVASKKVKSIADFKGKKVAFNPLSPSDFLLSYALQANKMTEKDVQVINMTPEAIPAAMASGSLPIGVTYEPNVSQIVGMNGGKDFHVVFSTKNAPGLITDVLVFKKETIAAKPAVVKALMQGYLDGLAYMMKNPDEAYKLIGKAMGISGAEVKEQRSGVYNLALADMPTVVARSKETSSLFMSGELIGGILKSKGQIAAVPRIEDTFDDSLLKSLKR